MLLNTLRIDNIARITSEEELLNAFRQCSVVVGFAWTAIRSGSDRLSARMEVETSADAESAISLLDGQVFDGSAIHVKLA